MSVMQRERRARDWWISPGHVRAAAVAAAALCALSFSFGVAFGRNHADEAPGATLADEDDDLEEVLARLHASSDPHEGVASLTWPDALRTAGDAVLPVAPEARPEPPASLLPAVEAPALVGDALPLGSFALRVEDAPSDATALAQERARLREAGHDAWIRQRLVGGDVVLDLMVGAYDDEAAAQAAREALAGAVRVAVAPIRAPATP